MASGENQLASGDKTSSQSSHKLPDNHSMHMSARPGIFERTFSPCHQKTRADLANALVLCVDNSEKPPRKSKSPTLCL